MLRPAARYATPADTAINSDAASASCGRLNEMRRPDRASSTDRATTRSFTFSNGNTLSALGRASAWPREICARMPGQRSTAGSRSSSLRAMTVTSRSSWRTARHSSHSTRWASHAACSAGESSPSWNADSRSVQCVLTGISPFIQVRAQRHPCAVELRLRRADRNAEHFSNLLVPIALDVVQDEHGSCARRQSLHRRIKVHPGVVAGRGRCTGHPFQHCLSIRKEPISHRRKRSKSFDDHVDRQAVEPGPKC